jgi:tripartite ATP-independent transporter DctP family solute receptor
MKRKDAGLKLVLAVAAAFSIVSATQVLAQATTLKLAHGATPAQAIGKGLLRFSELVTSKSGGTVKMEMHLSGSLYNERTALEAVVNGAIDMGGASNANWGAFTNTLLFMDLPYVFKDEASFRKVMHGPVGAEIIKRFEKDGFKLLMAMDNGGFRDVVNNKKQVRVPADLKGLKMRTTASPVEIAMMRNWGAVTTAVDWGEVYNALGQGVVDGEFVQPVWLAHAKHYEVLKHATEVKAVMGINTLVMRTDRFGKLPAPAQKAILDAAAEATAYTNKVDAEMLEEGRAIARKLGVQTYKPTAAEMQQWETTGRAIWKDFDSKIDKGLLKMVLDAQK